MPHAVAGSALAFAGFAFVFCFRLSRSARFPCTCRCGPADPRGTLRSVYENNDRRASVKRRINERPGSEIIDERSHFSENA
jgi:hypothetical protein